MFDSVAAVTGASQGIGRATAVRLARDFSALVLVARNRENLERTAEAVRAAGAEALVIEADLRRPDAARAVVDRIMTGCSRIDALLNIAGAVPQLDLFEMTDAQWDDGMALKLHGARRLTIAARRPRMPPSARSMPRSSPWPRRSRIAVSGTASR